MPYRDDMVIMSVVMLLILGTVAAEAVSGPSQYFRGNYPPGSTTGGAGGDGDGGGGGAGNATVKDKVVQQDGSTSEGGTTDVDFELGFERNTGMTVTLTWTDDIGNNDELGITLQKDGKEVDSTSGTSGSIELQIVSPESGNYTVQVSAIDCPGVVGPLPFDRDTGNTWSLEVTVEHEAGEGAT